RSVLYGTLTAEKLAELAPAAASADATAAYLTRLGQNCTNVLIGQFHRALKTTADEILDSLRPNFDKHAEASENAKSLFNAESSPDQILASGAPEVITAWQGLDVHIKAVARIAAIASQFALNGNFAQVIEYSLADNFRLDDRAIACSTGDLVSDSAVF